MKKTVTFLLLLVVTGAAIYAFKPSLLGLAPDKDIPQDSLDHLIAAQFTQTPTVIDQTTHALPKLSKTNGVYKPQMLKLANGLHVAVITNKRAPAIKQFVFYRVGSMDDPYGKSGIAHFLEHLMFLAKSKYAPPKQFDKITRRVGVVNNAYTTIDHTAYHMSGPKEALETMMKVEAGRMEELHITEDLIKSERDVILEERSMRVDNNPDGILGEASLRALFQNHKFGVSTLGWRTEMEGLSLKDAAEFHFHWYCPNNAILVIVGDVTLEDVKPYLDKYFKPIAARPIKKRSVVKEPVSRGVQMRLKKKSQRVKQPEINLFYKTDSLTYGDARAVFPLKIAQYILSYGQNSRLYKHFIKKKKLATEASFSVYADYMGPGIAGFSLIPAPGKSNAENEAELKAFIKNLIKNGLTSQEIEDAKKRLIHTFDYATDPVFAGGRAIGMELVRGRSGDVVDYSPDYIRAVTPEQVNTYLKALLKRDDYIVSELLPAADNAPVTLAQPEKSEASTKAVEDSTTEEISSEAGKTLNSAATPVVSSPPSAETSSPHGDSQTTKGDNQNA